MYFIDSKQQNRQWFILFEFTQFEQEKNYTTHVTFFPDYINYLPMYMF